MRGLEAGMAAQVVDVGTIDIVTLLTGEHFKPSDCPTPAAGLFHRGVEHANGRFPITKEKSRSLGNRVHDRI